MGKIYCLSPPDSQGGQGHGCSWATSSASSSDSPVMLRMTTQASATSKSLVVSSASPEPRKKENSSRNRAKYDPVPAMAKGMHSAVEKALSEAPGVHGGMSPQPRGEWHYGRNRHAILLGVAYQYPRARSIGDNAPTSVRHDESDAHREASTGNSPPRSKKLYVVEELEPYMEDLMRAAGIECTRGKPP